MKSFEHNQKLTVVNLFAGPGAGKSALAHVVTGLAMVKYHDVQYVHEYAKEVVWNDHGRVEGEYDSSPFTEQDWMLAHQNQLLRRLVPRSIDLAITDTSILLGAIYAPEWYPESFTPFLLDVYHSYNNINIFVDRGDIPFQTEGRNQGKEASIEKDREVIALLDKYGIEYTTVAQKAGQIVETAEKVIEVIDRYYPKR